MALFDILNLAITLLQGLIFIDVILSWLMPPEKFPRTLTMQITEPLYAPIRALIRPEWLGGLDISPLIIILLLRFMQRMLLERAF